MQVSKGLTKNEFVQYCIQEAIKNGVVFKDENQEIVEEEEEEEIDEELLVKVNNNEGDTAPPTEIPEAIEYEMHKLFDMFTHHQKHVENAFKEKLDILNKYYNDYINYDGDKSSKDFKYIRSNMSRNFGDFRDRVHQIEIYQQFLNQIIDWRNILKEIPEKTQRRLRLYNRIVKFKKRPIIPSNGCIITHYINMKKSWAEIAKKLNDESNKKRKRE